MKHSGQKINRESNGHQAGALGYAPDAAARSDPASCLAQCDAGDRAAARAGHNVVLHEFAHKLDGLNGVNNGMPSLRRGMDRQAWAESLGGAYDRLCLQVAKGEKAYINPYAATSPAEFFAVASEYFFTAPDILKDCCPAVQRQLVLFYRRAAVC